MKILLILFIVVPIAEMWVLIKVGGVIGALNTIALVLLTAVVGVALLRQQGFKTLLRAGRKMDSGELPARELVEAVFLAVGGVLLLTPGFITDTIGLCCLIPGIRHVIIGWGLRHIKVVRQYSPPGDGQPGGKSHKPEVIEGDFKREDQKK